MAKEMKIRDYFNSIFSGKKSCFKLVFFINPQLLLPKGKKKKKKRRKKDCHLNL